MTHLQQGEYPFKHGENKFKGEHYCSGNSMTEAKWDELKYDEERFEREEEWTQQN